jgi:hypothetical protein
MGLLKRVRARVSSAVVMEKSGMRNARTDGDRVVDILWLGDIPQEYGQLTPACMPSSSSKMAPGELAIEPALEPQLFRVPTLEPPPRASFAPQLPPERKKKKAD